MVKSDEREESWSRSRGEDGGKRVKVAGGRERRRGWSLWVRAGGDGGRRDVGWRMDWRREEKGEEKDREEGGDAEEERETG